MADDLHWVLPLLIGIGTALVSGVPLEHYKRHRDRQATAAVIAGDISALVHFIRESGTVAIFEELARSWATKDSPFPKTHYVEPTAGAIYEKSVDKMGLLDHRDVKQIALFYGYLIGVRSSIKNLATGAFEGMPNAGNAKAVLVRSTIKIWMDAENVADELVPRLTAVAAAKWWPFEYGGRALRWTGKWFMPKRPG